MRATLSPGLLHLTPARFALYRAYLEGHDEATLHAHDGLPGTDVDAAFFSLIDGTLSCEDPAISCDRNLFCVDG
ncbi:TPA: hypothetical protein QDB11_005221 [Burkholderia vietnamiensis]|uniref:hypothetical protein n=1 Tax=Burkholderia vietnamiensis TaxID=60552 RepID=UPI0026507F83|nr:hypothetical protein [Burkholderia vietnamiensis]MDN8115474.1 hypothetical protein [Burkholderia vietnamiensis]HDR9140501.1 hypothetical protein [Burkholderia vietnamiensis]